MSGRKLDWHPWLRKQIRDGRVHERLVLAFVEGRGVRLSADEVAVLAGVDSAVAAVANTAYEEYCDAD